MAGERKIKMRRLKLTVGYDGTAYSGWQVQPGKPSVQGTIEAVLGEIVQCAVRVNGSGRTDAGVHGRGQVAHVDVATRIPNDALFRALNSRLPADIRLLKLVHAKPDFDARRSAHGKEYRYFVVNTEVMPPHRRLYAAHVRRPLDVAAMQKAAAYFVGNHDFAPFSANPQREIATTIRYVSAFSVRRAAGQIVFSVKGDGFLYKQVRSMVGFLLRVGEGRERPEAVKEILDECAPRTARVPSAPACGLFLWRVWYRGR